MEFHPGRKTRTAPGISRLLKYVSKESISSKGMSLSDSCLMVCCVAREYCSLQ